MAGGTARGLRKLIRVEWEREALETIRGLEGTRWSKDAVVWNCGGVKTRSSPESSTRGGRKFAGK